MNKWMGHHYATPIYIAFKNSEVFCQKVWSKYMHSAVPFNAWINMCRYVEMQIELKCENKCLTLREKMSSFEVYGPMWNPG